MASLTETKLAEKLKEAINYPLLVPNNLSQAGWPDRFIQLPNSRIVACELKIVDLNREGTFHLAGFRQTQAAWLANWQRNGGLCFLLVGINRQEDFVGYAVIRSHGWKQWLTVNKQDYDLNSVSTMYHMKTVMEWLDDFVEERRLIDA